MVECASFGSELTYTELDSKIVETIRKINDNVCAYNMMYIVTIYIICQLSTITISECISRVGLYKMSSTCFRTIWSWGKM